MTINEALSHLNEMVRYKDDHLGIDGEFEFKACTLRKNQNGLYGQAELLQSNHSVLVVALDKVQFMSKTGVGVVGKDYEND